jgi:hypothetical protein
MGAINLGGYTQAVRALGAGNLLKDLSAVRAPTLVAVGALDRVTMPEYVRLAYDCLLTPFEFSILPTRVTRCPRSSRKCWRDF